MDHCHISFDCLKKIKSCLKNYNEELYFIQRYYNLQANLRNLLILGV